MRLTNNQAKSLASLLNVAGDKNNPMSIQGIKLTVKDGKAVAYSTNRYIIAQLSFDVDYESEFDSILPLSIVKFLKTAKSNNVSLEIDNELIKVQDDNGLALEVALLNVVYPPVAGLIEKYADQDAKPVEMFALDLGLVASVAKLVSPADGRNQKSVFKIFTHGVGERGKMSPFVFKRDNLVVLVQPAVI